MWITNAIVHEPAPLQIEQQTAPIQRTFRAPSEADGFLGWPGPRLTARLRSTDFIESYQLKYEKAADCRNADRDVLMTFHDFLAEH